MRSILVFIFCLNTYFIFAQEKLKKGSHWGFKAGANFTQMSGDHHWFFFKKGFEGGMFVKLKLSKKLRGQVEALFLQKVVYQRRQFGENGNINLWYFEVPVLENTID